MPLNDPFWIGQDVYITEIFLPVIIGVLIFAVLLVALFILGFLRHYRLWKLGQPDDRSGNWWVRLITTLAVAVTNIRIIRRKELYPGIMHVLIFGGATILILGKVIRLFSYVTGITNPPQSVYLYASWASELGAVLLLIGGGIAVWRRYIIKPQRLDNKPEDSLIYIWVLSLTILLMLEEAVR